MLHPLKKLNEYHYNNLKNRSFLCCCLLFQSSLLISFFVIMGEGITFYQRISTSADGGPRSRVCARQTLCAAPHRHGAYIWEGAGGFGFKKIEKFSDKFSRHFSNSKHFAYFLREKTKKSTPQGQGRYPNFLLPQILFFLHPPHLNF